MADNLCHLFFITAGTASYIVRKTAGKGYYMQDGLTALQEDEQRSGRLRVEVTSTLGYQPVTDAVIGVYSAGTLIGEYKTDHSGRTEEIVLKAPPFSYSQQPDQPQPFSLYTIRVQAEGYRSTEIDGVDVFAEETAVSPVRIQPLETSDGEGEQNINVPVNTLWGDYPPKIAEDEIKPVSDNGEIVLSRVVIPEYVIVHDGPPSDRMAKDYYVKYRDYIKNVASGEIYSTWPDAALRANVLAIMSFTLNRVYTEWYRGQGYDFTITSSTAYDQTWSYGRNIFRSISQIVDEMFNQYLSRPNVRQPVLTQFCDGKRVSCPGWLSQWGAKYLGDQGYSAIEILRYYYGSDLYINSTEEISGIPASWPGNNLSVGSSGTKVRQMQEQLDVIARSYPAIPRITADGVYGEKTQDAVRTFQGIFDLPETGVVDFATWYKISQIYVGVSRLAELRT